MNIKQIERHSLRPLTSLVLMLVMSSQLCFAGNKADKKARRQANNSSSAARATGGQETPFTCPGECNPRNGIVVGETKVFDERSLALKLQALEASLANLQFFDQPSLAAAIGRLQGASQETSALAFRASTLPIPGVTTKTTDSSGSSLERTVGEEITSGKKMTGGTEDSRSETTGGTSAGTSNTTKTTTGSEETSGEKDTKGRTRKENASNSVEVNITQPALSPTIPALPQQTSAFSFQGPIGMHAEDLLLQQENLNFQIINLRTLLERSLSDRLYTIPACVLDGSRKEQTFTTVRPVAVVGFEISIDPQSEYKDAISEAEITIIPDSSEKAPSLVIQLPNEKTYNVATITKDAKLLSLGTIAKVVDVGFQFSKTKETLYVVKDTDTVSLQRLRPYESDQDNQKALTFVWQFRPVLGQKAVAPGKRQVYALLGLPNTNLDQFTGQVEIHTHWRKYDARSKTVGEVINGSQNYQKLTPLVIPRAAEQESLLEPRITSPTITWTDAGNGLVNVIVDGVNFMAGTSLVLGDVVIDRPSNGLVIQGEHRLQFITSAQKLASIGSPLILGRYGNPVPLIDLSINDVSKAAADYGIRIRGTSTQPIDARNSRLLITLVSLKDLKPDLTKRRLIVKLGDKIFLPGDPLMTLDQAANPTTISVIVPTQQLRDTNKVMVRDFFCGSDYIAESEVTTNEFSVAGIVNLANDGEVQRFAITGSNFTDNVEMSLGDLIYRVKAPVAAQPQQAPAPQQGKGRYRRGRQSRQNQTQNVGGSAPEQSKGRLLQRSGSTLLLFEATSTETGKVKQIILTQGNASPVMLAFNSPEPLKKAKVKELFGLVAVSKHDSRRIRIEGENLRSIKEIKTLDGQTLKFEIDTPSSMTVFITDEVTSEAGRKDLNFVLKDDSVVAGFTVVVLAT